MSKLLNSEVREQIIKKWSELGLLDGISGNTTNHQLPIAISVYAKTIENPDYKNKDDKDN